MERLDRHRAGLDDSDSLLPLLEVAQARMLVALGKSKEAAEIAGVALPRLSSAKLSGETKIALYLDIAEAFFLYGSRSNAKQCVSDALALARVLPKQVWAVVWCQAYGAWIDLGYANNTKAVDDAIRRSESAPLPNLRTTTHLHAMKADLLELEGDFPGANHRQS